MTYTTSANLIAKYGLTFDATAIDDALRQADEQIKTRALKKVELITSAVDTTFLLDKNMARVHVVTDFATGNVVTKDDIIAVDYEQDGNFTVTDLNAEINTFVPNHPNGKTIVKFDNPHPAAGTFLKFTFYTGKKTYDRIKETLLQLEEMLVFRNLFESVDINKLQVGIGSWTLNGVTVDLSADTLADYKTHLDAFIKELIFRTKPLNIGSIQIGKGYDSHSNRFYDVRQGGF